MRKSYSAEMLLIFFSALSGIIIWQGGLFILIGMLFMGLTSYFLTSLLKTATIKEYIAATQKTSKKKLNKNDHGVKVAHKPHELNETRSIPPGRIR